MSYIGSTPTTQSFIAGTDSFNGTGSATNFTLSRLVNSVNDVQVVVNNVVQYPPNYSVSGTTLTISPAPSSGTNNVYVRYLSTTLQSIAPSQGSSIQFGTGSAALPSITFIGDTNTGIYSPAADTIAFVEGGTEAMRIDTSGNVGIGTSSPSYPLTVGASTAPAGQTILNASLSTDTAAGTNLMIRKSNDGANTPGAGFFKSRGTAASPTVVQSGDGCGFLGGFGYDGTNYITAATITFGIDGTPGTNDMPGRITFNTTADGASSTTERMRIDSAGNVGIGTSSPASNSLTIASKNVVMTSGFGMSWNSNATQLAGYDSNILQFITASAERMRIDSSGSLTVGATSMPEAARVGISSSSASAVPLVVQQTAAGSTTQNSVVFYRNTTGTGTIQVTGTTTAYNTSSDYRLKENVQPMIGALAKVAALKPVTYTWKLDGSSGEGFIAHELAEVVPQAVGGEKDAVNEDGSIKPQGIDTSFLVATLTAAIQELKAEVDALRAQVEAK